MRLILDGSRWRLAFKGDCVESKPLPTYGLPPHHTAEAREIIRKADELAANPVIRVRLKRHAIVTRLQEAKDTGNKKLAKHIRETLRKFDNDPENAT